MSTVPITGRNFFGKPKHLKIDAKANYGTDHKVKESKVENKGCKTTG